jgi:riboflavin kinase/FMN adenylyltransferase
MNERNTVIALGFFDGLHRGHAALLRRANERAAQYGADSAILTFDVHPDTFVKGAPVELLNSAADRGYIARRFFGMERIFYIHFAADTVRLPWQDFMEDVRRRYDACGFVVGHDFNCGWRGEGTAEKIAAWCAERGLGCDVIAPVTLRGVIVSSSHIRTLLRAGDMTAAADFLGHPHLLTDTVRTGFRIGRTMDYPTVNMRFEEGVLVPPHGVYISRVVLPDGSAHGAVTNIGVRPTFDGARVTVETHILDYSADLYGQRLCVELLRFERPERRFDGADALRAQIRADAAAAREYLKQA